MFIFVQSALVYAYRCTFEKPISFMSSSLLKYAETNHKLKNTIHQIGVWAIHAEEGNIIAASQRKHFRKSFSSNHKKLEKGAEICSEIVLIGLLGVIPVCMYLKKLMKGDFQQMDKNIQDLELSLQQCSTISSSSHTMQAEIQSIYQQQIKIQQSLQINCKSNK